MNMDQTHTFPEARLRKNVFIVILFVKDVTSFGFFAPSMCVAQTCAF